MHIFLVIEGWGMVICWKLSSAICPGAGTRIIALHSTCVFAIEGGEKTLRNRAESLGTFEPATHCHFSGFVLYIFFSLQESFLHKLEGNRAGARHFNDFKKPRSQLRRKKLDLRWKINVLRNYNFIFQKINSWRGHKERVISPSGLKIWPFRPGTSNWYNCSPDGGYM